jgi:hypothetical protein
MQRIPLRVMFAFPWQEAEATLTAGFVAQVCVSGGCK